MREVFILIGISLLLALTCVAVASWAILTAQLGTMDGILLMAVCLTLALIFLLNGRSIMRDEPFQTWRKDRKSKGMPETQQKSAPS